VVLALTAAWLPAAWGDPQGPRAQDRAITQTVTSLLRREHLTKHPLDDEIARRCVTQFVKMLDPMKVYFYQSDVDAFMARRSEVENVKKGDVALAYAMFQTFLKRVDERVALVDELLAMPHDFTVDEEMLIDRDAAQHPKDPTEARDRWRKRIKYDLLVLKADRLEKDRERARKASPPGGQEPEEKLSPEDEAKEALDRLKRRYHNFARRMHQTDNDELLEMYLTALSSSFDPHTSYMSADTVNNFLIQMRLNLEGIGAALQSVDGYTVVNKLIPGGPAEKDGRIKVEDKIIGVGQGKDGPIEDVVDMKLSDVVKLIRGPKGTVVRLEIMRGRSKERKIVEITRAAVELKDSEARSKVFEAGKRPDGKPYRIGVIDLPSFYMDMDGARAGLPNFKSTTRDVRRILEDFNRQGVDALVLDLRRNGGGSLQEAISLTGLFLDEGPVVQVKDADGRIHPYPDVESGMAWKGPMVVLISKFSASASEILAGAIQDYGRGLIVGDHATHGKGTVQSLRDVGEELYRLPNSPKLGALKITMQQFYRPDGDSTQKRGVLADIEWPSITSHLEDISEADLDYAIPFDRVPPQEHQRFGYVNKALVERLRELSALRIRSSEEFRKVLKNIARYEEQKKKKFVSLNEQKFLAERAELNADREDEKQLEELQESGGKEIKRDHYLDEALAISVDYLQLAFHGAPPAQAVQADRQAQND
jgi:carboxyl-terminal processing protease